MRKPRFTTEQLVGFPKEHEAVAKIAKLCRRHEISDHTYRCWKRKYGGMQVMGARWLKIGS